jgi:hypothetical protein
MKLHRLFRSLRLFSKRVNFSKFTHKLFHSKGYLAMHLINYAIFLAFLLHNLSCLENMIAEIEMQSFKDTWIQKAQDIDANNAFSVYQ